MDNPNFQHVNLLLVTPTDPNQHLSALNEASRSRIHSEVGKSISQVDFFPGDLHIYPANYGSQNRFVEGISINVLEMACLGIRSLISKNGADTWPELVEIGMVRDADWTNIDEVEELIDSNSESAPIEAIREARRLIDVQANLEIIFNRANMNLG